MSVKPPPKPLRSQTSDCFCTSSNLDRQVFDATCEFALRRAVDYERQYNEINKFRAAVGAYLYHYGGRLDFSTNANCSSSTRSRRPNLGTVNPSWYYRDLRGNRVWLQDVGRAALSGEYPIVEDRCCRRQRWDDDDVVVPSQRSLNERFPREIYSYQQNKKHMSLSKAARHRSDIQHSSSFISPEREGVYNDDINITMSLAELKDEERKLRQMQCLYAALEKDPGRLDEGYPKSTFALLTPSAI
eukprot:PhM_4_TR7272/c0_g1_i1/m.90756